MIYFGAYDCVGSLPSFNQNPAIGIENHRITGTYFIPVLADTVTEYQAHSTIMSARRQST